MSAFFFDTSALTKQYRREARSDWVESCIGAENSIYISRLAVVEMESALARHVRLQGVSDDVRLAALKRFYLDVRGSRFAVVALTPGVMETARGIVNTYAPRHGIRTLDAIQLACAQQVANTSGVLTLVSSDQRLNELARVLGLPVTDPERPTVELA